MSASFNNDDSFVIEPFYLQAIQPLSEMANELWPDSPANEHRQHFSSLLDQEDAIVFLLRLKADFIGFVELSSRYDYVEGAESLPVGYVEGIFIRTGYRNGGWGKRLLDKAAEWARERGYSQLCSDCSLENEESIQFHLRSGFAEVARVVCFARDISMK